MKLSVIICAHNPRPQYLTRTLDALRQQSLPPAEWEFLLIDNASKLPLSDAYDLSWHPDARIIPEPKLGLSNARQRGIRESVGGIIVFVDDDNELAPDYLQTVLDLARDHPTLGTWGSAQIIPEFEITPPAHLSDYLRFLALRDTKVPMVTNDCTKYTITPVGAGMCVRRDVALAYVESVASQKIKIGDRTGTLTISGGDFEISHVGCEMGYVTGMFPSLRIKHLIPRERLSDDYMVRLLQGVIFSTNLLHYKWKGQFPANYKTIRGALAIIKNVVVRQGFHRRVYLAHVRAAIQAREVCLGRSSAVT